MDPRVKLSLCRAIFRETRRFRNAAEGRGKALPSFLSDASAPSAVSAANSSAVPKKASSVSASSSSASSSSSSARGSSSPKTSAGKNPSRAAQLCFQMPSVTELWGTGVYQEPELHQRSLRRLLPAVLSGYVPALPSRVEMRRDVKRWLDSEGVEAFQILKALKYQHQIASCSGREETNGLRVEVVSGYSPAMSQPERDRFVFSYNVRFTNVSPGRVIRVIGRSFVFQNSDGAVTTHVRPNSQESMGVVGFTPVLQPGDQFVYGSGCTFNTPVGFMSGRIEDIELPCCTGSFGWAWDDEKIRKK